MQAVFPALLVACALALGTTACTPKAPEDILAEKLLEQAQKRLDPKRLESELARLTNQLTPQQKQRFKEEAQRLINRL